MTLAYRNDLSGKYSIQFAKEAFDLVTKMQQQHGECSVIAIVIKGYFDNINHKILKEMWCKGSDAETLPIDQFKVFKSLANYSYVNHVSFLKHFSKKRSTPITVSKY